MRVGWSNAWDSAVLVASSEIATLPVENTVTASLASKWYTVDGVTTANVVADMATSKSIGGLAVLGTNFTTNATVRLRGSNSDSTGVAGEIFDSGVVSNLVSSSDYQSVYYVMSAHFSARYWRIDLVNFGLSQLRVGRIFLGPLWSPTRTMQFGWSSKVNDESVVFKSRGGQTFLDVGPKRRILRFTIGFMFETEMFNNAFELARASGRIKDILVIPRQSGSFISQQSIWGLLLDTPPVINSQGRTWQATFEVEERL